jgi:hypothetical protein
VSVAATPDGQAARSRRTIEQVLAAARSCISRLTATQAADARGAGAVVVDIRPAAQREAEGALPGC